MADPVFADGVTPLNAVNMNKLQTRDEKGVVSGYAALDAAGYVLAPVGAKFGADTNLYRSAANTLTTDGYLNVTTGLNIAGSAAAITSRGKTSTGVVVFGTNVTGDTVDRLTLQADGRLNWGPGSGAADTNLYRRSASELASDGDLTLFVKGVGNGLTLQSLAGHATDYVLNHYVAGEAANRFRLRQDGQMVWGPGTGATDTNLYRSGAGTLRTDGVFFAGGQVGVDIAGTGARLTFGSGGDTYLYRGAANLLKTDNNFSAASVNGPAGTANGAQIGMRTGSVLSFEWSSGSLKFFVDNTQVKSL